MEDKIELLSNSWEGQHAHIPVIMTRPPSLVLCIQLPEDTEDLACLFLAVPFLLPPVSLPRVTGISVKSLYVNIAVSSTMLSQGQNSCHFLQNVAASGLMPTVAVCQA